MEDLKDLKNKKDGNYEILNSTTDTIEYSSKIVNDTALNVDLDINKDIVIENLENIELSSNIKKIKIDEKKSDDIELYSCKDNCTNNDNNKLAIEKEELIFNNYNFILDFKKREKFSFSKIGSMYCLWFDEEGSPKIAIGPHCQILSYTITFSANPGLPDKSMSITNEINKNFKGSICKRCGIIISKGKRIVHCDDCDVCIVGYDHHCPWTSKCIGRKNLVSFQAFITFTMVFFGFLIFSLAIMKK